MAVLSTFSVLGFRAWPELSTDLHTFYQDPRTTVSIFHTSHIFVNVPPVEFILLEVLDMKEKSIEKTLQ